MQRQPLSPAGQKRRDAMLGEIRIQLERRHQRSLRVKRTLATALLLIGSAGIVFTLRSLTPSDPGIANHPNLGESARASDNSRLSAPRFAVLVTEHDLQWDHEALVVDSDSVDVSRFVVESDQVDLSRVQFLSNDELAAELANIDSEFGVARIGDELRLFPVTN